MRDLAKAIDDFDLIDRMNRGRKATVYAKYLIVDDNAQSKEIEHVGEVVPNVGVAILARALGIEAVRLSDTTGFMVASNQMNTIGVSQFQTHE